MSDQYYKVRVVMPGAMLHLASRDVPKLVHDRAYGCLADVTADWIVDDPDRGDTIGHIVWQSVTAITWRMRTAPKQRGEPDDLRKSRIAQYLASKDIPQYRNPIYRAVTGRKADLVALIKNMIETGHLRDTGLGIELTDLGRRELL